MNCPKCGYDVGEHKFCPECGNKMSGGNESSSNKDKGKIYLAVIIVLALALVGTLLALFLPKLSNNKAEGGKPSEISFSLLRSDFDSNAISSAEKYNDKRFYFHIYVTGISSNGVLTGIIRDSNNTKSTEYDTSLGFGARPAWKDNGHMWWVMELTANLEDAKNMVVGGEYFVSGKLNVMYNGDSSGLASRAKISDIRIVEE